MGDHEERQRQWRERPELVRLGLVTQSEAIESLKRSLPRTIDAVALFDRAQALLGERAVSDYWATPRERCLILRDPQRTGWLLPRRLLYLELDHRPPEPMTIAAGTLPDWLTPPPFEEIPPDKQDVVALAKQGRSARLRIEEGLAYIEIVYNDKGLWSEATLSVGDIHTFSRQDTEPFRIDPLAKPPQIPPLSLLCRDDLRPQGHPIDELAQMLIDMHPERVDKGRVYVPAPTPGGATGCFTRGVWHLRLASWEGRIDNEGGFVIADAFNGTAVVTGPTFEVAFERWRELVARVQPLPPVERPPQPIEPMPETPPESSFDEETGTLSISSGTMRIVIHPPVQMPWPEPRPENVPAIAIPIEPAPEIPAPLRSLGFGRVLRLFGEQGETAFAFLREDEGGYTLVGDEAAMVVDPETLDADIERLFQARMADYEDDPFFSRRRPWDDPDYPFHITALRVWNDTGRRFELANADACWTTELAVRDFTPARRYNILRIRVRK